tara:strand:+ start:360 stop:2204 length:1845 start_codon:yes stop_codon:yes gene_type:complete
VFSLNKRDFSSLIFIAFIGIILFFWGLGSSGLIDETPAKFAAAGRSMSSSGNWLTPISNGIPRFDKPPLIYWLMGLIYSIPTQSSWDPLGSFAARFPSAISSLLLMTVLCETLLKWPQKTNINKRRIAVVTSLSFALSPFVMIWSRTAVSDALLCGTFGLSMLLQWRCYVKPKQNSWVYAWIILGFSILAKGPVAIVLMFFSLFLFGLFQNDFVRLRNRIKPGYGLLVAMGVSLPWFIIEYILEGNIFLKSFFGYHNFQRYTSIVNSHQEGIFFFIFMLLISSLPFTPLLILGLIKGGKEITKNIHNRYVKPSNSLLIFSISWILSVFIFFTLSGTKLPSYWLPAIPAAAIIVGQAENFELKKENKKSKLFNSFWWLTILFLFIISFIFLLPIFIPNLSFLNQINDNEMKDLSTQLLRSGILVKGGVCLLVAGLLGVASKISSNANLLSLQIPIIFFQLLTVNPLYGLIDLNRQLPLRQASDFIKGVKESNESIAMVGIKKPSVHFYTNEVILYESNTNINVINLSERLSIEKRIGWEGYPSGSPKASKSVLIIIDDSTSELGHWQLLNPTKLASFGIYNVWRVNILRLNEIADKFKKEYNLVSSWRKYDPERY